MGCVHPAGEHAAILGSPDRSNPVLLGGAPSSGVKSPKDRDSLLDDALEMPPLDTTVTFSPYFKVVPEKREEWRRHCAVLRRKAEEQEGCLFHRASFGEELVHLRQTFADATAMLRHLRDCREAFCSVLELSTMERVQVHGPRAELDKVGGEVESIGGCRCALFELRPDSVRRPQGDWGEVQGVVSIDHYFHVGPHELPLFKCYHCAAFSETAGKAPGLERHSVSFSGGLAHLSEDFADAEAAILHLQASSWAHSQALRRSAAFSMEVHGPEKELEKIRGWLALMTAKLIEDEDIEDEIAIDQLAESPRRALRQAVPDRVARQAVAALLLKAAMFDLGSRQTVPCARTPGPTPRSERKVLFADPPVEGEEPVVLQLHVDTAVALGACFRPDPESLAAWREPCEVMIAAAVGGEGVLHHSVSHGRGRAQIHAGFRDAAALLAHLRGCEEALQAMLDSAKAEWIEVHAPRAELAKVRRAGLLVAPLLTLLELTPDGLRADRPHSGKPGSDSIVSLSYRILVQESDLPTFKRNNCSAFHEMARAAGGLEHHSMSFGEGVVHLRQGFTDAHAALAHLRSTTAACPELFRSAAPPSLDVRGPPREVEKMQRWTLSAASRAGQAEQVTEVAVSMLGKASIYILDCRSMRRNFVGRTAPTKRQAAAVHCPPPAPEAAARAPSADGAPPVAAATPGVAELDEDVERFHFHDGRCIELRRRGLTALGAEGRAEADALAAERQATRSRAVSGGCGTCAGKEPVCGGAVVSAWCR